MSRAVALRLLGACLVAVLAGGLLGMHTLGLHGTSHGGHSADAVHASTDAHQAAPATHGATDHDGAGGPADGMAMACLFLLVVGALLLLPRLRGGLRGGLTLPRPPPAVPVVPLVVDGRPPPLLAWAVVRC